MPGVRDFDIGRLAAAELDCAWIIYLEAVPVLEVDVVGDVLYSFMILLLDRFCGLDLFFQGGCADSSCGMERMAA